MIIDEPGQFSQSTQVEIIQRAEQSKLTRSDIASHRRAAADIAKSISKIEHDLIHNTQTDAQTVSQQFMDIRQLKTQYGDLESRLDSFIPKPGNAKLNQDEMSEVRALYLTGRYTQAQIGDQFGIKQNTVSDIVRDYRIVKKESSKTDTDDI